MLFGFENIRKKFGQCFVIWVSKCQLTDCIKIKKKKYISDSILDFRRMCRPYFGFRKDVQTVFWTSEGYADSVLDFRRICRQCFGLQKDMQTVFWTLVALWASDIFRDGIFGFRKELYR